MIAIGGNDQSATAWNCHYESALGTISGSLFVYLGSSVNPDLCPIDQEIRKVRKNNRLT
jgi:hypothetical protein